MKVRVLIILSVLSGLTNGQQYGWKFDGFFPDSSFHKGGGCAGLAVDPAGNVWIQLQEPSDSLPSGEKITPLYCYSKEGVPRSFSPLRTITVNAKTDTLRQANGGIINGPNGNIIFSSGPNFYRMNYVTLEGMNVIQPTAGVTLRAPAVDKDAGFYTAHNPSGYPVKEYDENINFIREAVPEISDAGRTIDVTWDGLNLFVPRNAHKDCYWYKRVSKTTPFTFFDSLFTGSVISSMRFERNRGVLWFDAGSAADLTNSGFLPNTWYGWDPMTGAFTETITWQYNRQHAEDEKPGAIAFSWTGDTAYAGCRGADTYCPIQRFVRYLKNQVYTNPMILDFGQVEAVEAVKTLPVVIRNYRNQALQIQNFILNAPFKLADSLQFPIVVLPFDSLSIKLQFSPAVKGYSIDTLKIISDDSAYKSTVLKGFGYIIERASSGKLYAACGTGDNGDIFFIDRISGSGSLIGASTIQDIKSIAIHPKTSIIYGLVSNTGASSLIRINSVAGDSYPFVSLSQPNLAGIAFDTSGIMLAASKTGAIFNIVLPSGTMTQLSNKSLNISSITVNPFSNELWASQFAVSGAKDKIFKIRPLSGDTVNIGRTGLNLTTNALCFDEAGHLYGVTGTSSAANNLILIDTSTAAAINVGNTGFMHVTGSAFLIRSVSSINGGIGLLLPDGLQVSANYPNPFNSTTNLSYSISITADVNIRIYDILGHEVFRNMLRSQTPGSYRFSWEAGPISSGVYFCKITVGRFSKTIKLLYLR